MGIRTRFLAFGLSAMLAFPALAEITFGGGDGLSMETAVIVQGAVGESDGVRSEYAWLDQHYPGYTDLQQSLLQGGDKVYDGMRFRHGGKDVEVFFDITGFFGKY